jgi:hypothetical protein
MEIENKWTVGKLIQKGEYSTSKKMDRQYKYNMKLRSPRS